MFIIVFLTYFLHLQLSAYINAINKQYPFKIGNSYFTQDFVLLIRTKQFRNGISTSAIDPGQHNILFVQEHSKIPDNILLTMVRYGPQSSPSQIKYSFYAEDLSITGFTIKSALMTSTSYSNVLLGYLTITNGYGITLKNNFDISKISHQIINGGIKNYFWQTGYFIEPDENYLISPFINTIDVKAIGISTIFVWTNSTSFQQVILQLNIDGGNIQTLVFSVLLVQRDIFQEEISSHYLNYNFTIESVDNVLASSSSPVQISSNTTSTIYYFGTIHSGKLRNNWNYAVNINDVPIPYLFNSTFIINRNYFNKSHNSIFASITWNASVRATVFSLSAISCNSSQYPYLLMSDQRCFNICPQKQYNDSNKRCNNCSVCTDINHCQFCSINACNNQQYYVVSTMKCNSCQDFHLYCIRCSLAICSTCEPSTLLQLINGLCQCNMTMYFQTTKKKCQQCYGDYNCFSCINPSFCLSCQFPFQLTIDNSCLSCVSGYIFISSNSSCKQKINPFDFELLLFNNHVSNIISIFLIFEGDINLVTSHYSHEWKINNITIHPLQTFFKDNNTLKADFFTQNYFGSYFIEIKFTSISSQDFLISKEKSQNLNIEYDSSIDIFKKFKKVMNSISQNSNIIVPVLSITSILNYLLGILWDFQTVSYYIFVNISKPPKLQLFLNVTFQLQNKQVLPIQIPNPFSNDFKVTQNTVYNEYNVDIYFLRSIFEELICFIIFSMFYYIMNLLLQKWNPKLFFLKKLKSKFVDQMYSNISVLCFSYLLAFGFISSASLSNTIFNNNKNLYNYSISLIGLCVIFTLAMIHIIILAILKENKLWDTQNCYMGFNRQKKYSQITFGLFVLTKLLIPVCITLFNPIFSVLIIIICSFINLIFFTNIRTLKYQISIYYRIISQLSFIIYNLMYVVFYIIQTCFSNKISNKVMESLGWLSIALICLILIMDILELFTEIILDIIRFVRRLMLKYKITNLHSYIDSQTLQSVNIQRSKKSKRKVRNNSKCKQTKILKPGCCKFVQTQETKVAFQQQQNTKCIFNPIDNIQNTNNKSRSSVIRKIQKSKIKDRIGILRKNIICQ